MAIDMTLRAPVRVGDVLVYFDDNGYFIVPARSEMDNPVTIGVALEMIPEGSVIAWDVTKREGYIQDRCVIAGVMRPEEL